MAQSHSQSQPATPGASFASGLLARLNASTRAAQEARRKATAAATEQRERNEQLRKDEHRNRARAEVDKIVRRNAAGPRLPRKKASRSTPAKSRERGTASAASRDRSDRLRHRPSSPVRTPRPRGAPPKALPGMEFVVRKTQKKQIKVPHTSDYSDLFGDDYLRGVDLGVTTKMAKESAAAAKENEKILRERAERRERQAREAQEFARQEEELRAKGLTNKQRRQIKCAASAKDWVAVEEPIPLGGKRKEAVTRALASDPQPKVRGPEKIATARVDPKQNQRQAVERKRLLKERIMAATGGAQPRPRSEPEDKAVGKKRRRVDDEDEFRGGRERKKERRAESLGGRRTERRDRGYHSDDWEESGADSDDNDDDDDDEEDLFGIDALEREEQRSLEAARAEDKHQRMLEKKHRREKEKRREEHERRHGGR